MENVGDGEFFELHNENDGKFSGEITSTCIKPLIDGSIYIRDDDVIHRVIKPENLSLNFDKQLILADFGRAVANNDKMRLTFCSTLECLPPEMLSNQVHDHNVYIWWLGVLTCLLHIG